MNIRIWATCALLVAAPVWAEPGELSLDDVARLALEQQPNLDAYTSASAAATEAAVARASCPIRS